MLESYETVYRERRHAYHEIARLRAQSNRMLTAIEQATPFLESLTSSESFGERSQEEQTAISEVLIAVRGITAQIEREEEFEPE